jgi:hypothetical protein
MVLSSQLSVFDFRDWIATRGAEATASTAHNEERSA